MYYNQGRRIAIIKFSPGFKKHGLSILVTLAVHLIVILLMAHYFISIKIVSFEKKVTNVYFPGENPLVFSRTPSSNSTEETAGRPKIVVQSGAATNSAIRESSRPAEKGESPGRGLSAEPNVSGTATAGDGGRPSSPPIPRLGEFLLSRFSSDKTRSGQPDLVLGPPWIDKPVIDTKKYGSSSDINLGPILYSGVMGGGGIPSPAVPRSGSRGRTSGTRELSPQARIYDISPWAGLAVEHVQKAWAVLPLKDLGANLTVRISVLIEKSGALVSMSILESSEVALFDQAAIHAVEQSVPFPRLPDDFPEQRLEILLIFESHD